MVNILDIACYGLSAALIVVLIALLVKYNRKGYKK